MSERESAELDYVKVGHQTIKLHPPFIAASFISSCEKVLRVWSHQSSNFWVVPRIEMKIGEMTHDREFRWFNSQCT